VTRCEGKYSRIASLALDSFLSKEKVCEILAGSIFSGYLDLEVRFFV
jgi:hypothetical protein